MCSRSLVVSRRVSILLQVADSIARLNGHDPSRARDAKALARFWAEATVEDRVRFQVFGAAMRPDDIAFGQFVSELEDRAERLSAGA